LELIIKAPLRRKNLENMYNPPLRKIDPAFDEMTPMQVIEVEEIDRLWVMVHDLGSGQPE
jgi:hypothetical protein